ncbi:serine/threonine-protein kinase PknK [Corallococcus sp. AB030]|uniref:serine/threonine-protein kinase n=1 Tax=Corallococcus TaxID=83461 RepID=UPI000EEA29AC|nr:MULTISPECIES: serine/threonine-protein kinase [Corallococcus]NRD51754.1 protein kinase [Corallococcus exiguus]RKI15824.1 serine/threonine-protein kinase PknK [Corallococcus sp. AB030]
MTLISRPGEPSTALPFMLGDYRITRILGRGGMGVVYRAEHREHAVPVALKTVRASSEVLLAGIRREIHALRRLNHPGIARILDEGFSEGLPYYVMELFEGGTLRSHLGAIPGASLPTSTETAATGEMSETLPAPAAPGERIGFDLPALRARLSMFRRLCAPLAHLHGEGFVHRDLKPENIFIREDGRPVLVDLGIAASFSGAASREELAAEGRVVGSVAYMAPEQLRGELVDARADLYALGCILYECLVGRPPFIGSWAGSIVFQHLNEPPAPPSRYVEGLPEELEWLVLRLLEKRPEARLGYAEDVAHVLDTLGVEGDEREGTPRPRSYLYRPGLEGRAGPLADLGSALEQLRQERRGQLILLEGESGVGKTRLAMEVALLASQRQVRTLTGQCALLDMSSLEQGRIAVALHPFRPLLQWVADRCRERGDTEAERLLGTGARWLALYEPALAELPWVRRLPELPVLPPAAAQPRILEALRKAFAALTEEQPVLLVLDDLQWADELSLAFLKTLADRGGEPGLLILGTCRLGETGAELTALLGSPGIRRIALGRLDTASVGTLVAGMLALRESPAELVDFLADSSSGNPFFVAEYLRAAIDEGMLVRDRNGAWKLRWPGAATDRRARHLLLPHTLAALIERRLSLVGDAGRALVEHASVLGREFDSALLPTLAGLAEAEVLDGLGELRRRQLIEETASGRLRFVHDRFREIAYGRMALERRRELHLGAAHLLESRFRDVPDLFPELGHHFSQAGLHDKAILYLGHAAERARATYANGEAIRLYQAVLHEMQQAGEQLRAVLLHEALGDVLALVGRHEEARSSYAFAMEGTASGKRLDLSRLHRKAGKAWETQHAHEAALTAYLTAEQVLGETPSEAAEAWWNEWLQARLDQLAVHYWTARLDVMEELSRSLQPTVERHGTPLQQARFFQVRVQRNLRAERYLVSEETVRFARDYLRASEAANSPAERAEAECVLACVLLWHGALEEAATRLALTVEQARRTGDVAMEAYGLAYLPQIYRRQGAIEATREAATRSLRAAEAGNMTSYVGAARANLGWVALREGRTGEARTECEAALQCWATTSRVYPFEWLALLPLMQLDILEGCLEEASRRVARLVEPTQQHLSEPLTAAIREAQKAWSSGREEVSRMGLQYILKAAQRAGYL